MLKRIINDELSGWKAWEILWLVSACTVIFILSVYWHDTPMGIISATTGVACVVCTGKGKLMAYVFGTVNVVLYAIISLKAKYYGEVMLNLIYYFPMEFYGFYIWMKHMDPETKEVEKRWMSWKARGLSVVEIVVSTFLYGLLLKHMGDALPFIDAFTTAASVITMIVSVWMYVEQWLIWIAIDVMTVAMWYIAFRNENDSIATLLMWVVYLGNAIIMYFKWKKEADHARKAL